MTVGEASVERHPITRAPGHEVGESTVAPVEAAVGCNEQPIAAGGERVERNEQPAVRRVPKSENAVVRRSDNAVAVGTPCNLRCL
jgi:hypothetical protein